MDMYREVILDHYKNPRNFGHLKNPDMVIEEDNVTCGDRIIMEIKVNKKNIIEDIRFSGEGCAISQASASMLTEEVKGKNIKKIMALSSQDIILMLGTTLTPSRIKCATLSLEVLHKAVLALKRA
jgi:nitrogen fixation NifU-like protein